jgi:hypothetical protein
VARGSKVNPTISRETILKRIESCLESVEDWAERTEFHDGNLDSAYNYQCQALALIELLEVDDCGSCGGYDARRGQPQYSRRTLKSRYEWLKSLK